MGEGSYKFYKDVQGWYWNCVLLVQGWYTVGARLVHVWYRYGAGAVGTVFVPVVVKVLYTAGSRLVQGQWIVGTNGWYKVGTENLDEFNNALRVVANNQL